MPQAAAGEVLAPPTSESDVFLIKADQWPTYDGYESLDPAGEEIRLLELKAGKENDEIMCTLRPVKLTDKPNYNALSYYWGAPVAASALRTIRVDGTKVNIRLELHSFLGSLLSRFHQLTIWLDVLCINQEDGKERVSQVSMMGRIYSSAQNVYAWLGGSNADSDYVFDAVNGLIGEDHINARILSECLEQLFWRPYWTRMWVIQEFSLAKDITLVCGNRVILWEQLERQAGILHDRMEGEGWNRFDRFGRARRSNQSQDESGEKTLFNLMEAFQHARCVDPRDKVYALLSLSSDGKPVTPDYSISAADLFFRLLSLHPPLFSAPLCGSASHYYLYRNQGPWEVADRIQDCIPLTEDDLLASCRNINNDQLYTWLRYISTVASVQSLPVNQQYAESSDLARSAFSCELRDETDHNRAFRSSSKVRPGDEIFRLGDISYGHTTYPEVFVILRPSQSQFIDMVVQAHKVENEHLHGSSDDSEISFDEFELLRRICLNGMKRCRTTLHRYEAHTYVHGEVILVHITRLVFCVIRSLTRRNSVSLYPFHGIGDEIISTGPFCSCKFNSKLGQHEESTSVNTPPDNVLDCLTTVQSEKFLAPMRGKMYSTW